MVHIPAGEHTEGVGRSQDPVGRLEGPVATGNPRRAPCLPQPQAGTEIGRPKAHRIVAEARGDGARRMGHHRVGRAPPYVTISQWRRSLMPRAFMRRFSWLLSMS